MDNNEFIRGALLRVLLWALVALFAIPAITYGFIRHVQAADDREHLQYVEGRVRASTRPSHEQDAVIEQFRQHPLSGICDATEPGVAKYRAAACATWGRVWQFDLARKTAQATLALGAAILLLIAGLGVLAFANRAARLWSLIVGWRLLMLGSAVEVALQGAMCLWLSYWVTAFFFKKFVGQLVAFAAIAVVLGIVAVVRAIFRRPQLDNR